MRIFARILRQEARYFCCRDGVRDITELHAWVHLLRVCGLGVQMLLSDCISCKVSDFEQVAATSSSIKSGGSIYVSVLLWNLIYICVLSRFFATLWTVARLAPVSMRFSRQEYWSRLSWHLLGDLADPGNEPLSPALQADAVSLSHCGSPRDCHRVK